MIQEYISRLNRNKELLSVLAVDDFKEQYRGSYLGLLWAVLRPACFVGAIWFVFEFGLKGASLTGNEAPFLLHLLCGYIPWLLFADSLSGSMNSLVSKRHLLRQAAFQPSTLPIVKFFSCLILHFIFLLILIGVLLSYGYKPTVYWLQLPLILAMLLPLLLGLGWLTSSLRVFSADIAQLLAVVLQVGFWVTPVFWSLQVLPETVRNLVFLNPMVCIVESYRSAFLREQWLWDTNIELGIYLIIAIIILAVGGAVFSRLKPHFGEVL